MSENETFGQFWHRYLRAHRNPTCRAWHYGASVFGLAAMAAFLVTLNPLFLIGGVVLSYGCAWIGHFFVEGNTPLAFTRPLWSLAADYRMFWLALTGRLGTHLAAADTQ
ncbi:MAG: DUF962 domain-containing protein [Pseudomonadota bacterium]